MTFTYTIRITDRGWYQFEADGMIIGVWPTSQEAFGALTTFAFNMTLGLGSDVPALWTES